LAINQKWPKISKRIIKKISKIAIQVNGKTKNILEVGVSQNEETVKNLAINDKKIKKIISNNEIKKIIFVPEKILNIVLK